MSSHRIKGKEITIFISIFTISLIGFVIIRTNRNRIDDSINFENSLSNKIQSYSVKYDLRSLNENEYNFENVFRIRTKINKIEGTKVYYSFSINNSNFNYEDYIIIDESNSFAITIYKVGNYFAFKSTSGENVNEIHLIIFDKLGNLYKDLYEIDQDMKIESISFYDNCMYINTSRIVNNFQIQYNNIMYNINEETKKLIPNNLPTKIQYKYTIYENSTVDFLNPYKKVIETFEEFCKNNI